MKLTATQKNILQVAADRPNGDIEPLPSNVNAGIRQRVIDGLLQRKLIKFKDGYYRISSDGFDIIGRSNTADKPVSRSGTKQATMIEMLQHPSGTTIEEMAEATGWQRHTVRGAMSNALKKRLKLTITSSKYEGSARRYRIVDGSAS
jgi:hypothetical protein